MGTQRVSRRRRQNLRRPIALLLLGGLVSCSPIIGDGNQGGAPASHTGSAPASNGPRNTPTPGNSSGQPTSATSDAKGRAPASFTPDTQPAGGQEAPAGNGDPAGSDDSPRAAQPVGSQEVPADNGNPAGSGDGPEPRAPENPALPTTENPATTPGDPAGPAIRPRQTGPAPGTNHAGSISVEGINRVGHTFSAKLTDPDGVPDGAVTYQWHEFYGALVGTGETIYLTKDLVGMQVQVTAEYTDNAGNWESITSRFSGAIVDDAAGGTGQGITSPAEDAPRISLSGPTSVPEDETATYTVTLDRPMNTDVSADIRIDYETSDPGDAGIRWDSQRVVVEAGQTSATFYVDTTADGIVEGDETYRVSISNAVVGTVNAAGVNPIEPGAAAQSVFMLSYKHPLAQVNTTNLCDYWKAIHAAGSDKIPYVLIMADASPNATVDPGYVFALKKNVELGFKNIVYVRTNQQTRDIAEVKANAEQFIRLYGEDRIQGFYFDEISSRNNAATAYLAELYNYVKEKYPDKLVVANPGTHITDAIAPYADIFMTNEGSADEYLNHYRAPFSAFESDPANSHRIMHTIYEAKPGDYQRIIDLSRSRNAGWVFITTDTTAGDGRPYNDLATGFPGLVDAINDHGTPADPFRNGTLPVLTGANIGVRSVRTTITSGR